MPYQWNAERERQMLLLAISRANLRPSADTWTVVAALLGGGLSASAVSQKYYKLRNDAEKKLLSGQIFTTPKGTPTKRKREDDDVKPSVRRVKKSADHPVNHEYDGQRFSDDGNSVSNIKTEETSFNSQLEQQLPVFYGIKSEVMPLDFELKCLAVKETMEAGSHHFNGGYQGLISDGQ
ncbi:hypothetical protein PV10_04751 [Exophiala mesophila]|uniref:Myb-like domain-containing protein n=1 Tax=Exophiala mesophila TaxID=212818 RepID=A0A0D1XZ96_EXOME|nr:uncharacterized protein PV10_04751 [Exophiala mesophila]KIV93541.1 hypothetical protein PV10_04751 [Exophiala mesophila]